MQPFGYERPTPHLILTDNIHSDTQAVPRKLSSLTLYIDLWQEGKPAPGQNPPVISPPVIIFRRIGVRAEIRTQNPVLSNTRLAKMVPLSHLRRRTNQQTSRRITSTATFAYYWLIETNEERLSWRINDPKSSIGTEPFSLEKFSPLIIPSKINNRINNKQSNIRKSPLVLIFVTGNANSFCLKDLNRFSLIK
jgi:hypothetical protein